MYNVEREGGSTTPYINYENNIKFCYVVNEETKCKKFKKYIITLFKKLKK